MRSLVYKGVRKLFASLPEMPSSVLVAAVSWLQATLLGTITTTIATIAIVPVGFMMLTGRVNVRYGLTVIIGGFILFGASTIVASIHSSLASGGLAAASAPPRKAPPPALPTPPATPDPYAGASLPPH